ncbi:restriction endonuclease [Clostridiisalibacter paucivorans]|uniref:restriction endonuclease n=1 Tax=Clostridiisalibacter paucivorans TaxID=408753 RepID=UPI0012ECAC32|nr:restriction endonuclease [Clostridiisalibacter paucivorans]
MNSIKKLKIKNYYIEKSGESRNVIALFFDRLFMHILIATMLILSIYFLIDTFVIGLIIFIIIFSVYISIVYFILMKIDKKRASKVHKDLAKKKLLINLSNKSEEDFSNFIIEMFTIKGFKIEDIEKDNKLDIIAQYKGESIGIKIFQRDKEYKVNVRDIKKIYYNIKKKGIKKAIILTISSFDISCKEFIKKINKEIRINLIDIDKMMLIIKDTKQYPSKKELEEMIFEELEEKKDNIKYHSKYICSKDKILKYVIISFILYLLKDITVFKNYYIYMSLFLLFLAIGGVIKYIYSIIKKKEEFDIFNNF